MTRLPTDWKCDRLKDVAAINGDSLPADTSPDYEFDYLEISNVDYHGIVDPRALERLRYEDAPSRARRRVAKNCTVISSVRPNLQAVAFVNNGRKDFVCSTGFNVVQPAEHRLSPKFAYYALISEGARQYFEATAKGVGYPAVDDKDFDSFPMPLPPLPEPQCIAAYLDASCAAIDAAVVAKRRQLETLDALRKSTIQRAVTRGISARVTLESTGNAWMEQIPRGWKLVCLKRIAEIQGGLTLGKQYEGPLIERPYLRVGNVQDGHLDLEDVSVIELPASGETNQEIDFVFFLNGLPIVDLELKHEANQNVHNAVAQFGARDHAHKIFQHPFLYLAADTSDVMAATDPRREENFRWHNIGLTNTPTNPNEYPVEFLYREVLSKEQLLEALSFFLVRVPAHEAKDDKPASPAFTVFPRYHQGRLVRKISADITAHFAATGDLGKKYLADHSAGSGKTLSICWLADHLNSLYKPGTNEQLVDITFILTDRKSLDTNVREDIEKFTHLKDVVGIAKKADDLPRFLKDRKSIIVTTQQKLACVLEELQKNPELKNLRVAFLIDEAHRSQEGQMGAAIRLPFRTPNEPDADAAGQDPEELIAQVIREHDVNQLFVAFTATASPATVSLFGAPFDSYTEAEAIQEGYIVDVAASIISYKTLYNLHCHFVPPPDEEVKVYSKGVVAKALTNVAFADDGLIQYKAEVMLRIFEEKVMPLIGGRAKAMIVASSRVAGLRYFNIIREKLKERGAKYKVLCAFSDFRHPETNAEIHEHAVNKLKEGENIEDRFKGDDYRILVVASKFQAGFNQPLLAGMFLDKPVVDRNAVQTVSRLNRKIAEKQDVVVVDFTNNATAILKAFQKYRKGTPFAPEAPDKDLCPKLYNEILAAGVFIQKGAADFTKLAASGTDAQVQFFVNALRTRFLAKIVDTEERKAFVYLLGRYVKAFHFLSCFFSYAPELKEFATFAEYLGDQLIKAGSVSDLMKQIRQTEVIKAAVAYQGVTTSGGPVKLKPGKGKPGPGPPPKKVSVQEMIADIKAKFQITDEEALYIKQVTEEKSADPVLRTTVTAHRGDRLFLEGAYRGQVNGEIQDAHDARGRYEELSDPKYTDPGGIFDIMALTVIQTHLSFAA